MLNQGRGVATWDCTLFYSPFCLFFRLVKECNRASLSGAKGCRAIVAIAKLMCALN